MTTSRTKPVTRETSVSPPTVAMRLIMGGRQSRESRFRATALLIVAKNLGHSDTRMVEKHYGHLAPSYIADAIRAGDPLAVPRVRPLNSICKAQS
jgi:integrase